MSYFTTLVSRFGELFAADSLVTPATLSTYNGALTDEGADSLTAPTTDLAAGWFCFPMQNGTGLDIRIFGTGASGAAWNGRLWTVNRLTKIGSDRRGAPNHWCKTPAGDISGTLSSNATGCAGGIIDANTRWATGITISGDGGLAPLYTREMRSTSPTQARSRLIVDPVCAQFVLLQLIRNAATGIGAVAFPWQRS